MLDSLSAMIWHIAKNIAAEGAVLCGNIDAILLTGGMAKSDYIIERLKKRLSYLAPIHVYPGQDEMQALTENALAVLRGEREQRSIKYSYKYKNPKQLIHSL